MPASPSLSIRPRAGFFLLTGLLLLISESPALAAETVKRDIDDACRVGIQWLIRHQNPDGSWSPDRWKSRCTTDAPCSCRSAKEVPAGGTAGLGDNEVATTALCLLAICGYSHTHQSGHYPEIQQAARRAIEWLISNQIDDEDNPELHGMFASSRKRERPSRDATLSHALALQALGFHLMISRDRKLLRESVTRATEWSLRAQNEEGGWSSPIGSNSQDYLEVSLHVLAIRSALACSMTRVIRTERERLDRSNEAALEWIRSRAAKQSEESVDTPLEIAAIALAEAIAGRKEAYDEAPPKLKKHQPRWRARTSKSESAVDPLFWYLSGYLHFQASNDQWGKKQAEELIVHQRVQGCNDGSWDPIGDSVFDHSRMSTTALALMTLEPPRRTMAAWCSKLFRLEERRTTSK